MLRIYPDDPDGYPTSVKRMLTIMSIRDNDGDVVGRSLLFWLRVTTIFGSLNRFFLVNFREHFHLWFMISTNFRRYFTLWTSWNNLVPWDIFLDKVSAVFQIFPLFTTFLLFFENIIVYVSSSFCRNELPKNEMKAWTEAFEKTKVNDNLHHHQVASFF